MADRIDERSLGELFSELSQEISLLVKKEMRLATTEITAKAKTAGAQAGEVAAGSVLAHAAVLVLLAAVVLGLVSSGLSAWLSALIVGVTALLIAYMLVHRGFSKLKTMNFAPTQTLDSLKETATWTSNTRA